MPRVAAERELLASPEDVWSFLSEPHHLADWWPGIGGIAPDRRGLAEGARWQIRSSARPGLLRRAHSTETLLVRRVDPYRLLAFHLTAQRVDAELRLEPIAHDHARATLTIRGPFLAGLRRSLPRKALTRLHALCQTAVEL